ncbi:MAG: hypothetical protein GX592_14090 [Clostridiales bacterium]|nr:hypothetical protein [Clostridiales bacterium]
MSAQESLLVLPYYSDGYYGYVFAELTNAGDKPVEFSSGLVELFDADGNSIASSDVYYCYPPVMQPGENSYIFTYGYVATREEDFIDDYMLSVTGKGTISRDIARLNSTARYEQISDGYSTYGYLIAVIENNTENVLYDCTVVYAMKDADGKPLYAASTSWSGYNTGVMPGSFIEMRTQIGSDMRDYMDGNNIVPASMESIAYYYVN